MPNLDTLARIKNVYYFAVTTLIDRVYQSMYSCNSYGINNID